MPTKPNNGQPTKAQSTDEKPHPPTIERHAFVAGLFGELTEQVKRYTDLVAILANHQARISIVERNLQLTRDHLQLMLSQTHEAVPVDWQEVLFHVRFVGARLGDACIQIVRESEGLTTQDILDELNLGQFRFRTGTPLREINAALLRQPNVKKQRDQWVYTGTEARPTQKKKRANNLHAIQRQDTDNTEGDLLLPLKRSLRDRNTDT